VQPLCFLGRAGVRAAVLDLERLELGHVVVVAGVPRQPPDSGANDIYT
jgi:hypothetical protein